MLWKKSTCSASNESWTRWNDRTDTDGNQTTVTTTGINDATGIPVSMNIAIGNNKRLTISAGSTGQWWVDGHNGETRTFFKLDNVQLKCKGLYLNAIAQPLPNDNTTLLLPNVWYYYDVDYPCEHWLIGNLNGMVYSTDGDKFWLSMNYILATPEVTNLGKTTMNIYGYKGYDPSPMPIKCNEIPIQRNHRTVVTVSDLTTQATLYININPAFNGDH